jgi:hypothetical protein
MTSSTAPIIGTYDDRPIPEWIERSGEKYTYNRPAQEDANGAVALAQLRPDEVVIAPGLIYRRT